MYEIENLNGIIRILSFLALLVMMGVWMVHAKKALRLGSACLVIFLTSFSIYITNGFLYALGSIILLLLIPVLSAMFCQIYSYFLLKKIEKKHGNSGVKISFKPFDIYRKYILN